ncbi:MAG: hypothetical protein F6K30_19280 [Cyanothece sp. SIO2G6]|nr:hypothetical protein [Cyanothece sp. SIO2G6]
MTDAVVATRTQIAIGSLVVDGFMLPDGSYRMSLSQVAESVGLAPRNAFDFLRSKAIKGLLGEGYTDSVSSVEIESSDQSRGQSRISALPLEVVTAYWVWQTFRGNKKAIALVMALATETLERRFDAAFGVELPESQRNERLASRIDRLSQDLERLGEAYAVEDDIRRERDYFAQLLREQGIDPYELPPDTPNRR